MVRMDVRISLEGQNLEIASVDGDRMSIALSRSDYTVLLMTVYGMPKKHAVLVAQDVYGGEVTPKDQPRAEAPLRRTIFDRVRADMADSMAQNLTQHDDVDILVTSGGSHESVSVPVGVASESRLPKPHALTEIEPSGPRPRVKGCENPACRREFGVLPYGPVPTLCTDCRKAKNSREAQDRRNGRKAPPQHTIPPGVDANNPQIQRFMKRDAQAQR